jgi:hypothetical protein
MAIMRLSAYPDFGRRIKPFSQWMEQASEAP